jgi:hypothetical protein
MAVALRIGTHNNYHGSRTCLPSMADSAIAVDRPLKASWLIRLPFGSRRFLKVTSQLIYPDSARLEAVPQAS